MALSRRAFLDKGYFAPLRDAIAALASADEARTALDICCGEGYYSRALCAPERTVYAFDLSKEMVRLAAKRGAAQCFVANISAIPIASDAVDLAIHLFAPFHDAEFSRVLHPDGTLVTVVPGRRHLMGMKAALHNSVFLVL